MQHLDAQLFGLDDIVTRIQAQNNTHHEAHSASLGRLASDVQASYENIGEHFQTSFTRVEELDTEMTDHASVLQDTLSSLNADSEIRQPLSELRADLEADALEEYKSTGQTPQRTQYSYPQNLPRTEQHEFLLAKLHGSPLESPSKRSPTKTHIFTDSSEVSTTRPGSSNRATTPGLREVDVNILVAPADVPLPEEKHDRDTLGMMPPFKRQNTVTITGSGESKLPKKRSARMTVAGGAAEKLASAERENLSLDLSRSVGAGGMHPGGGRRKLRSHNSNDV